MASLVENGTVIQNGRVNQLGSLNQQPQTNVSLAFGTGFGAAKRPWSDSRSIWGNGGRGNLFLDGAADANPSEDRNENDKFQFPPANTASHTVFGISGKDSWNKRPNIPWNTSGSTTSPTLSSPREYSAPSSRQSNGDFPTLKSNGSGDMRGNSTSFRPDFTSLPMTSKATPLQFNNAPVFGTGLRNLNSDPFRVHADSRAEAIEDTNTNSFYANKALDPTGSMRHGSNMTGSEFSGQRESSNGFSDAGDTSACFPDLRASIFSPAHARFNKDISQTTESSFSSSKFAKRPSIQVTSGQIGPDEETMASAFGRLGIHSDRMQVNGNNDTSSRPFEQQSVPPKRVPGNPSLSRTRYRNFPEEMPMVNASLHDMDDISGMKMLFPNEYSRSASFGDQGSISPTSSEYRRNLNSPYYSNGGTPLTGPDSGRSASGSGLSSRASNGQISSLDQQMRMSQLYQSEPSFMTFNPLQARMQYPQPYEFSSYPSSLRLNPLANPYTMPPYHGPPALSFSSRYPSREHDPSQITRSPLLEDFRANHKTNKRYEFKDIFNHIVEFSGDQHGSRFIQQKLETANSDEKDQVFTEIHPNSLQLMTDVFGNYVIQKLFEHGNQAQKKILANQMKGHVMALSTQMYGCRVVQKAFEHILTDQQASLVKELENHVLKCVKDQNGNHVIQKAIERIPAVHIQFIINAFTDQVQRLAAHPYGCRVIQRMLEHCEESARQLILRELYSGVQTLITDQFGNYVIQHVIENGAAHDKRRIVSIVIAQLLVFSKHKFASNVVEKSIEFAEEEQRGEILRLLTLPNDKGETPVLSLMRDQYGNYVVQKVLGQLKGPEREVLVNQIKPQLSQLKKFSYGKQILAIEKLIFEGDADPNLSASSQSSTLPSTNASTVEGPVTPPHIQIHQPSPPKDSLNPTSSYFQPHIST